MNIIQLTEKFKEDIYNLDKLRVDSTVSYLALDDKLEAVRGMLFLFKPLLANGTDIMANFYDNVLFGYPHKTDNFDELSNIVSKYLGNVKDELIYLRRELSSVLRETPYIPRVHYSFDTQSVFINLTDESIKDLGNTIRIDTNSGVDYIINCGSDVNTESIIILLLSNIKPIVDRVIKDN
nr:MAG TPA: Cyclin-dependent kinase 9 [Caudoviricetes sp.]